MFPFNHSIRGTTELSEWYQKFGSGKVKKFADNPKEIKRCFEILGFHELGQVKYQYHTHQILSDVPSEFNDQTEIQVKRKIEVERGSDYKINGKDVLVVNSSHWMSEIGARLAPDCDFAMIWYYDHNDKIIKVSKMIKQNIYKTEQQ